MNLHQINLGYEHAHDRLLLRVSTQDKLEYRFWLTRRLVKELWPALVQLMRSTELVRSQPVAETQRAMLDFQREQALHHANFQQPYQAAAVPPGLPGEPLLVARVRLRAGKGSHEIAFLPGSGPGVHLQLSDALLHAFAKLLQDAMRATGWDLALVLPAAAPAPPRKPN